MTTIEGIGIPDSKLCKEITELVRDTETELLFNHSSWVYYFGALTGLRRGLQFDREMPTLDVQRHWACPAESCRTSAPTARRDRVLLRRTRP